MRKGFSIKEVKQHGVLVFMPLAYSALIVPFSQYFLEMTGIFSEQTASTVQIFSMLIALVVAAIFQNIIMRDGNKKLWGYFVCSTPAGHKGYLLTKYSFVLACALFNLIGSVTACTVYAALTGKAGANSFAFTCKLGFVLFAVQLILRAIDIPLTVRFGEKKGSMIKLISLMVLIILYVVLIIIKPETSTLLAKLTKSLISSAGKAWFVPLLVTTGAAVYGLSYFLTCKLFIKGIENAD